MAKNEVATTITTFINTPELPAHIAQNASGLGSENVSSSDMLVSRLDLFQALSPQLIKDTPEYLEGGAVGKMFDSVTGEIYDKAFIVNLYYDKKYQVFRDRKAAGGQSGFEGSFDTLAEANAHIQEKGLPVNEWKAIETDIHACLLLDGTTGKAKKPIILYMSASKMKVSKGWNTDLNNRANVDAKMNGGAMPDRFAYVWLLETVQEKSGNNRWQNYKISYAGRIADPELYAECKATYMGIKGLKSN
jgi:hypothetical protein